MAKADGLPAGVVINRSGLIGVNKKVPKDVRAHPDWANRSTVERSTGTRDRAEGLRRAMRILVELEDAWQAARRDMGTSGPVAVAAMTAAEVEAFADTAETLIALEHDCEVVKTGGEPLPSDPGRLVDWVAGSLGLAPAPHLLPVLADATAARLAEPTPTTPEARYIAEARRVLAPAPRRRPTRTLADLIALFESERLASLHPRSKSNYTTAFAALREVVGDATPLALVDRDSLRAVRDAITARRLAIGSQRKYVRAVGTLFAFAVAERWMDANPALGLAPKARPDVEGGRRPFSRAELAKMFPQGWRPVSSVDWLLALGLFQGMRAEEAAQLETADIAKVDDTWAIHIRAWSPTTEGGQDRTLGKSVKNTASERVIPIHARIEGDLVALANARRKAGERLLLPGVKRYGLEGYYGSLRKALAAHLDALGVKSPGMCHHALRHNFRDACRAAQIPREHVLTLGGWSLGKGAEAEYGGPIPPTDLKPSLDALAFLVP